MSELKPCPFCASPVKHIPGHTIAEPIGQISCLLCGMTMDGFYYSSVEDLFAAWNRRSDTTALLRGARIGLEMAAKWHDSQSAEWREYARRAELECDEAEEDEDADEADLRASACREHAGQHLNDALKLRAITDADIMKEISRET